MPVSLAGTSPARDWETGPAKVLADYLESKYNQSVIGIPFSELRWNAPYSVGAGDYGTWFQPITKFKDNWELGGIIQDQTIYINMHVYILADWQTYSTTDRKSGEYFLDRFEVWLDSVVGLNKDALIPEGILRWEIIETRDVNMNAALSSVNPLKEFDESENEINRRIFMFELGVQKLYNPD